MVGVGQAFPADRRVFQDGMMERHHDSAVILLCGIGSGGGLSFRKRDIWLRHSIVRETKRRLDDRLQAISDDPDTLPESEGVMSRWLTDQNRS